MSHIIDSELCTQCGLCESTCQEQAISNKEDKFIIFSEKCTDCGNCATECPIEAISKVE